MHEFTNCGVGGRANVFDDGRRERTHQDETWGVGRNRSPVS